jgi:polyadenylate-binding protein
MVSRQFSLFIGDLAESLVEDNIEKFFKEKLGPQAPAHIKICRDHSPPFASLRYGYLNFLRAADAEHALNNLNYKVIFPATKPYRLAWCQPDPSLRKSGVGNIFVRNLPPDFQTKQLHELFSDVGLVLSCRVSEYHGPKSGAHGYVQYKTREDAEKAISKHNNTEVQGRTVVVETARPFSEIAHRTIYITGFPSNVTKEELGDVLSKF